MKNKNNPTNEKKKMPIVMCKDLQFMIRDKSTGRTGWMDADEFENFLEVLHDK